MYDQKTMVIAYLTHTDTDEQRRSELGVQEPVPPRPIWRQFEANDWLQHVRRNVIGTPGEVAEIWELPAEIANFFASDEKLLREFNAIRAMCPGIYWSHPAGPRPL